MPTAIISEIMESWPLGLRLRVHGEPDDILVDLTEDCRIVYAGRSMDPGKLRCGMRVEIADVRERTLTSLEVLDLPRESDL